MLFVGPEAEEFDAILWMAISQLSATALVDANTDNKEASLYTC